MEHQQEKDNSSLPDAPALVTSIETGGLKFRRAPSNSRPSGGKATFISAELAFSQEQRRLFDKIGYNKLANQESKQRDLIEKHSQLRQHTAGTNQRSKVIKKVHTERENQSPGYANLESPMIIQNQFVDEARFTRGFGKLDESFYESKVNSLSKTRAQRQQILEDITNVSMRQPCQSANAMNRLINMRKLKETDSASLESDSLQESSQAEEVHSQENNRRQPNFQQLQRIGEENVRDLSGDRYFYQRKDSKSQCSQLPQTLILHLNGDSMTISKDHQRTSGSEGRIGTKNLEQQQQFMTRRNNLAKCNFLTTEILPEASKKAKTSTNSRDQTKLLSKRKLAAFCNDQSVQAFLNPMILRNDHRIEAFLPVEYDINYTCLAAGGQDLSGDQRSVISRGDNCFSSTKKLQSNRIMNKMSQLQFIPIIKGINRQQLVDLFQAKCQDLKITSSRDQMLRFFEVVMRNQGLKERYLNLAEQGFGNHSMKVIARIIKNNEQFSSLDLHKNSISNDGIRYLAKALMQNETLVHLDIGCNQMGTEGAILLFDALKHHPSLISLKLANSDCYKNKNKIGLKGSVALGDLLETNHMIQFVDLTDNSLSQDSLQHIIFGVRSNPNLVSLNLSQNDIGASVQQTSPFNNLLGIFDPNHENPDVACCASLEELVLSSNSLTNHHLAEFASLIKTCSKTKLRRLNLSHNRLSVRGLLTLLQALRQNSKMHITHLYMDKLNLEMGSAPEKVSNFYALLKLFSEYLRINKSLKVVSMNNCSINNEMMSAIGKGLQMNDHLETLSLKHNMIGDEGMVEAIKAFQENKLIKINTLDLSSNKISDACGVQLAGALQNVPTLEQLFLRDNDLSNEAGDAFFFLAQSQKKLCRIQLDMNTIRYGTLVDIERECKKNRKNLVGRQICELIKVCNEGGSSDQKHGGGCAPTFSTEHTPILKDAQIMTALDLQITEQGRKIQEGQERVIKQEEKVLEYISEGSREVQVFEQQVRELELVKEQLDGRLAKLDQQLILKGKEHSRKVEQEVSLLERCREYLAAQQAVVNQERQKLAEKTRIRRVNDDVIKLQGELDKALRDQRLMGMIADNYIKEINKRRQIADDATTVKPKTPEGNGRITQSANQILFFNKKQQALFHHHYASGNESMMLYEDSHGDFKKPSPNSSNPPNKTSSKQRHQKNPMTASAAGLVKRKKSTSVKRKKSNKRQ